MANKLKSKVRLIHSEPVYASRGYRHQICNWVDQFGELIFQERTHFPHNWFKKPSTTYWAVRACYADRELAKREAKEFGFRPELDPYHDEGNPTWFPIFKDFDLCVAYHNAKGGNIKVM